MEITVSYQGELSFSALPYDAVEKVKEEVREVSGQWPEVITDHSKRLLVVIKLNKPPIDYDLSYDFRSLYRALEAILRSIGEHFKPYFDFDEVKGEIHEGGCWAKGSISGDRFQPLGYEDDPIGRKTPYFD